MSQPLDEALAHGRLSKMGYLLARMREAEQDADRIIAASPGAQLKRLEIQADERQSMRPRQPRRYHD